MPEYITSVLKENRIFNPSTNFSKKSHVKSMKEYSRIYNFSVKNPEKFRQLLLEKEDLNALDLTYTVFQLLDELERVNKKDITDFMATHNIQLPPDIKGGISDKILQTTKGSYERVLEELKELERRAWALRKAPNKTTNDNTNGKDDYEDVI